MGARVAVAGASGYAGGELLRLLAGHPDLEIVAATAHSQVGAPLVSVHPQLALDLALTATDPVSLADADLVFLALPHGESAALAAALPATVKVVDLGSDHRGTWVYGRPELPGRRAAIAAADRVANTGCYAVATILALAPLIAAGLASPDDVVVVAASGTSGAGRTPQPHLLATEIMGSLLPYRVGAHQHVPEIKRATGARTLSMTPVLAPMPPGSSRQAGTWRSSSTTVRGSTRPRCSPPTGYRRRRCGGAGRCCGPAGYAPWCSTPAAPTPAPARPASRTPTRPRSIWPSRWGSAPVRWRSAPPG